MREVWVEEDSETTVLERYPDGTTRGYPLSSDYDDERRRWGDTYDHPYTRYSWRGGKFLAETVGLSEYPRTLPRNYTPDYRPEQDNYKQPRCAEIVRNTGGKISDRIYAGVSWIADRMTRETAFRKRLKCSSFMGCCLPEHHGILVPEIDAVIDKELVPLVAHVAKHHNDKLEFSSSCRGGEHDHDMSHNLRSEVGYASFTGPAAVKVIEAFGEDAWQGADDFINRYPTWLKFATGIQFGSHHAIAWSVEHGVDAAVGAVAETVLDVLGCPDNPDCWTHIEELGRKAETAPCSWCGTYHRVELMI